MRGMADSSLLDLRKVLAEGPTFTAYGRLWQETEMFLMLVQERLPKSHIAHVRQIRRSDPARGIRGSQLTITVANAAAASKIRLMLADWPAELSARGIGIQSVKIVAERAITLTPAKKAPVPRRPIPVSVKTRLKELALATPNPALAAALKKLAR